MKPRSSSVGAVGARVAAVLVALAAASACRSAPPLEPAAAPVATTTGAESSAETATLCVLHCEGAEVTTVPQRVELPDHHAAAVANANQVFAAMHADLLACYKSRVAVAPGAHASITVDVVINPDGRVRNVETTGGALLGDKAMRCIVDRVQRASFAPVRDGGTLRIHVPFSLRKMTPDESI